MPKAKPAPKKGGQSDLMRKFKDALDSKSAGDSDPGTTSAKGPERAQDVHGQADHKRVFRRKSV